jgi:hypothetical protein
MTLVQNICLSAFLTACKRRLHFTHLLFHKNRGIPLPELDYARHSPQALIPLLFYGPDARTLSWLTGAGSSMTYSTRTSFLYISVRWVTQSKAFSVCFDRCVLRETSLPPGCISFDSAFGLNVGASVGRHRALPTTFCPRDLVLRIPGYSR